MSMTQSLADRFTAILAASFMVAATAPSFTMAQSERNPLPLQKPEDRDVLKNQANSLFDLYTPLAEQASSSTVWVWNEKKRQIAIGVVIGNGNQVLTKWSDLARWRDRAFQCVRGDGKTATAKIVGVYEASDLAILELADVRWKPVVWSATSSLSLGHFVAAVAPNNGVFAAGVVSVNERSLREMDQAFLGIGAESHPQQTGVVVKQILADSPAAKAGLVVNDVIIRIDQKEIGSPIEFRTAISNKQPGQQVNIILLRDGKQLNKDVVLSQRAPSTAMPQHRLEVMEHMGGELSEVRDNFAAVVQTDMIIDPEMCGSPVINSRGEVVGLNLARAGRIRSYIISSQAVLALLQQAPTPVSEAKQQQPMSRPRLANRPANVIPLDEDQVERMKNRMREMENLLEMFDQELQQLRR